MILSIFPMSLVLLAFQIKESSKAIEPVFRPSSNILPPISPSKRPLPVVVVLFPLAFILGCPRKVLDAEAFSTVIGPLSNVSLIVRPNEFPIPMLQTVL
mmetsp:Transcript_24486/g.24079  ORF Transcript_24486/g.24079 Transcript_24486/m.24079 type:complete len:99 (-) Transcript_24486:840-1136(-)